MKHEYVKRKYELELNSLKNFQCKIRSANVVFAQKIIDAKKINVSVRCWTVQKCDSKPWDTVS